MVRKEFIKETEMKFEAKTYRRTGAIAGSIIGVLAMIAAICMDKSILGAVLLML